jgi:integrase
MKELPKREARKQLASLLRPLNEGRHLPQSNLSFAGFVKEHFELAVLPTLKFSTQQSYSLLLNKHLLLRFGDHRLCDIGRAEVQRFVLEKLKQGYSWEHANHLRNLLSKVLGTAASWGFLAENPVRGVRMPERFSVRPSTYLSPDEVRRLLSVLAEPVRSIVFLATLSGLSIAEILGLRWGRVDLQRGTLRVEENFYRGQFGTPKTAARRREVPLAPSVVQVLAAHRVQSPNTSSEALVFCIRGGNPLNPDNLRKRQLRTACQRAGLKRIGWHTLRHTHSTLLHELGTPLKVAQSLLGHSRLATTLEVYTHASTDAQREAVAKLEEVLDPNGPKSVVGENPQDAKVPTIQ